MKGFHCINFVSQHDVPGDPREVPAGGRGSIPAEHVQGEGERQGLIVRQAYSSAAILTLLIDFSMNYIYIYSKHDSQADLWAEFLF